MATTSLLYHAFGLQEYQILSTEYGGGETVFHVKLKNSKRKCAQCQCRSVKKNGAFQRRFREVPIGARKTWLVLHGHRHLCCRCQANLREHIGFSGPKKRHTRRFSRYVLTLARMMALLHVSCLLGTGWDMIKDIFKENLKRRAKKRKISKVRYIAIDEFAVRKGHNYISIIMDLESGMVLNASLGRDGKALLPFLYRLKRAQAPLKAVAVDMSPAFLKAVKTVFPNLDVVHDPYHVMALASRAVDTVRRDLVRGLDKEGKKVVKGSRFLLLKGLEKLSASHLERLTVLMESNRPLYIAYLLKEDLRRLWDHRDSRSALRFIVHWLERAVESGLKPFVRLALTIIRHLDQLLSYFSHRISTGPLEGLNNKIKTLKRQAYGYRDMEFFFLRILFIHESIYSITG